MSPRLGFLRAKRRTKGVNTPQRGRACLGIQLPRLRQIRLSEIEILRFEKGPRLFADSRGEQRRVDVNEVALVKEVVNRLNYLVADSHDGDLPLRAQPEVSMIVQEGRAVLLLGDRVVDARPEYFESFHSKFNATRRACVFPDFAFH